MKPLNSKRNYLTLILGTFLVFLIMAAPHTARAQDTCNDQPGNFYDSYGRSMSNMAGRLTAVHKDYLDKALTLDVDHYCMTAILTMIKTIRLIMIGFDSWYGIIDLALSAIVDGLILAVCNVASQLLQEVTSAIKNSLYLKICLPFPQLHLGLNLPHPNNICKFGGMPIGMIGLSPMGAPPASSGAPSNWQIWGGANSKFQVNGIQGP